MFRSLLAAVAVFSFASDRVRGEDADSSAGDGEVMVLGPRQFERDTNGGAVLCAWSIYLAVQTVTSACRLPPGPVDDAIDEAIVAMDDFILAHSSLHPTRSMLDNFKGELAASRFPAVEWELDGKGLPRLCSSDGREQIVDQVRSMQPDNIRARVAELLAVPREPVMNPCL
ncbi:MAG: hypothetical protein GY798_10735 [Hyphomicrobiales bacterium]|nr:hypothetical protein [Hyphomicrobiales bacterium]